MGNTNRFNNQLSISRISTAIFRRIQNLPHLAAWYLGIGDYANNSEQLLNFRDKHTTDRCFILGNGPSLKNMDLDLLKDEVTFGLNRIYLLFDQFTFRPSYFVSVNDLVLSQFADEIAKLKMPKFINWNLRKYYAPGDNSINYVKMGFGLKDEFCTNLRQPVSSGGTVTYVAMQIAYWMGFKEVILVGVDHSFADKGTPNKTEVRTSEVDKNHFHPDYFPKGVKWQLPDLLRSEIAYSLAKDAFENDNRKILDATAGGKLTIFDKVKFEDLF